MLRHFLAYVIRHVVLYKALQQRAEQEMAENLHKFDLDWRRRRNKTSTLQLDHFKTKVIFLKNFTVLRINFPSSRSRSSSGVGSNPYYLSIIGNYEKNTFNSIKKKNLSTICHFLQYFILQSYSTHSPEFTGLNWENKFLFILSFLFCWIRNNNSESRSGSRQKFRIHADPDPQH